MIFLRLYLLAGLVFHKAVWEGLKRRPGRPAEAAKPPSRRRLLIRAVKIGILLGIACQVFLPDVLPMLDQSLPLRVAGTALYTLGLTLAVAGRVQLGTNWSDIEVGRVASEHQVVCHGVYRYLRHPIYVGDLALLIGLELALNSWLVAAAAMLVPPVLAKAVQEERTLRQALLGYEEYARRTKRFIPFII